MEHKHEIRTIETIGVPKFNVLDKKEKDLFISILEFQIKEYYKNQNAKKEDKPP